MTPENITIWEWEMENRHNIVGWEHSWGRKDGKEWVWYEGFSVIIFEMKDGSKVEFIID